MLIEYCQRLNTRSGQRGGNSTAYAARPNDQRDLYRPHSTLAKPSVVA